MVEVFLPDSCLKSFIRVARLNTGHSIKFKFQINNFFFLVFLRPHLRHMKVSRLGVELELQLVAYTTAIAMPDPSCICDLHCSLWQCQILNPLREARDQTHILHRHYGRSLIHQVTLGTPCSTSPWAWCSTQACKVFEWRSSPACR